MKKLLLSFAFCTMAALTTLQSQNYPNILNYYYNGIPTYGVKIKTNLPFTNSSQMPTIKIEGYNFGRVNTIGLTICYYILANEFNSSTISSSGSYTPQVKLSKENDKVVIFIDDKSYFQRFTISVYANGLSENYHPEYFQGWTAVDEALTGSNTIVLQYSKNLNSNVGVGTTTPHGDMEIANTNGGVLSISTKGEAGPNGNPKKPSIDFLGFSNQKRATISTTEETGRTFSSKFSISVNDGSGPNNLVERLSIEENGNTKINGLLNLNSNTSNGFINLTTSAGNAEIKSTNSGLFLTSSNTNTDFFGAGATVSIGQVNKTDGKGTLNVINGNVGIGRADPINKFEVVGSNANYFEAAGFYNTYTYANSDKAETRINIGKIQNNGRQPMGAIGAFPTSNSDSNNGNLVFYTRKSQNMVERVKINQDGNVSIGNSTTTPTAELLTVFGVVHAKEVRVDLTGSLADFVFHPSYSLMPLQQVEAFVKTNSHLPEMPSAAEISKNGLSMGEMQNKLLQKIEELTLYVIEQQKQIEELKRIKIKTP